MGSPVIIDQDFITEKLEYINDPDVKRLRVEDFERFQFYSGNIVPILKAKIEKEFNKPETVEGLEHRLVPLNIVRKIINKLAGLYIESPSRDASNNDESDQELLDNITWQMQYNQRQKEANRFFRLFKRNLQQPFLDKKGLPSVKNLPRHTYEVFSHCPLSPNIPDTVVIILQDHPDKEKQLYAFWTDLQHLLVNGKGEVQSKMMVEMDNPEGINPFGRIPFVYLNESSTMINPFPDDDLMRISVLINTLLSDMAFASKYKTFNINYIIGYEGEIPANPNTIVSLPLNADGSKPEVGSITPEFNISDLLLLIENIVASLLATKNLSTNSLKANIDSFGPQSGIAKALDESQSIEDKKDQQEYFLKAEGEFWELLKEAMIPVWQKSNVINPLFNKNFSEDFDVAVTLRDPKITMTEQEQIKLSESKLNAGFSTLKRELSALNPDMDTDEIDQLEMEIIEDKVRQRNIQVELMTEDEPTETEDGI